MNIPFAFSERKMIFNGCHCQLPTVCENGNFLNILIADRNEYNKSYIRQIKFNKENFNEIISISNNIFETSSHEFDSDGQMPSEIINYKNDQFLFYTGWRVVGNKYQHSICMAKKCQKYEKWIKNDKPIIQANSDNQYLNSSPKILFQNNKFLMYFISGEDAGPWTEFGPQYKIWRATSNDCVNWHREKVNFPRKKNEIFSRPFVFIKKNIFHMLYTWLVLGQIKNYLIGHAFSYDGIFWTRTDDNAVKLSDSGWDSESVAFPYIWRNYVFYSGNKFGKDGFGYAKILL